MSYVGIDQSYSGLGLTWIVNSPGHHITEVTKYAPEKFGIGVARLANIRRYMDEMLETIQYTEPIQHICMEGYAPGSKFGREKAGELAATIKMAIYDIDILDYEHLRYPTIVAPTALKKFVTAKGTAKKNEMLLGCYKRWGVEFSDDNAADSYGLAKIAQALHTGKTEFKYEKEVLAQLTPLTERFGSPLIEVLAAS